MCECIVWFVLSVNVFLNVSYFLKYCCHAPAHVHVHVPVQRVHAMYMLQRYLGKLTNRNITSEGDSQNLPFLAI